MWFSDIYNYFNTFTHYIHNVGIIHLVIYILKEYVKILDSIIFLEGLIILIMESQNTKAGIHDSQSFTKWSMYSNNIMNFKSVGWVIYSIDIKNHLPMLTKSISLPNNCQSMFVGRNHQLLMLSIKDSHWSCTNNKHNRRMRSVLS